MIPKGNVYRMTKKRTADGKPVSIVSGTGDRMCYHLRNLGIDEDKVLKAALCMAAGLLPHYIKHRGYEQHTGRNVSMHFAITLLRGE